MEHQAKSGRAVARHTVAFDHDSNAPRIPLNWLVSAAIRTALTGLEREFGHLGIETFVFGDEEHGVFVLNGLGESTFVNIRDGWSVGGQGL